MGLRFAVTPCPICKAIVLDGDEDEHARWHCVVEGTPCPLCVGFHPASQCPERFT